MIKVGIPVSFEDRFDTGQEPALPRSGSRILRIEQFQKGCSSAGR